MGETIMYIFDGVRVSKQTAATGQSSFIGYESQDDGEAHERAKLSQNWYREEHERRETHGRRKCGGLPRRPSDWTHSGSATGGIAI